ncbi:sensor histidine kinase [Tundrisphaera lichenicola]|uniref:sensor histidine kinase n=1 Tax=Tundrisphaera lichenicola TaxID=2029860 RepID=UPI003EB7912A
MPRWPIRVKLIAGLSLVVGMMLTLMGGAIFSLSAFHSSNLMHTDLLRELGASKDLIKHVARLKPPVDGSPRERESLQLVARDARKALDAYFEELKKNTFKRNRFDDGMGERELAFGIDHDLTAILNELDPAERAREALPGTPIWVARNPSIAGPETISRRIERLFHQVMQLPTKLHGDVYAILLNSRRQYETGRVIVWVAALAVLAMLIALALLFNRWVLFPIRLLQRGVRRVARGSFDYSIELTTGDEMQSLAEAFNDMTARLRVTYADLERQVQERSRQLVRSERLAGVGFLAAGVAHEINNPLASIAFCSEALESRLAPMLAAGDVADAKIVQNYLRMVQEEAFRCKSITEKLLDFSRCGEIKRERTDLAGLIQGVVEMIRHMGKYRHKKIVFLPREAVLAHVDGQEIKQVVLNLVVNALDSMSENGTLRIELRHAEGMAEMVFADDGCGMSGEVLENIFEPFFTRRRVGKGTGLGLSITHRIVSQHAGEIHAESPGEGHGATFSIRLPVQAREPQPASKAPSRAREVRPELPPRAVIALEPREEEDSESLSRMAS